MGRQNYFQTVTIPSEPIQQMEIHYSLSMIGIHFSPTS